MQANPTPMTTQPWQEEFDKQFRNSMNGVMPKHRDGGAILRRDLLAFISTLISQVDKNVRADERAKTIKECAEVAMQEAFKQPQRVTIDSCRLIAKSIENLK